MALFGGLSLPAVPVVTKDIIRSATKMQGRYLCASRGVIGMLLFSVLIFWIESSGAVGSETSNTTLPTMAVGTLVKVFDATYPSTPFCDPPMPYDKAQAEKKTSKSPKLGFDTGDTCSAEQSAAFDHLPTRPPQFVEKLLMDSVISHTYSAVVAAAENDSLLNSNSTENEVDEEDALYARFINDLKHDLNGARGRLATALNEAVKGSGMLTKPGDKSQHTEVGARNGEDEVYATGQDLLPSRMIAAYMNCLIADSSISQNPLSIEIKSSMDDIGRCFCLSLQEGYDHLDPKTELCGILDSITKGMSCSYYGRHHCAGGLKKMPDSGFGSCSEAKFPSSSTTKTNPDLDYDLYLNPFSVVAVDGVLPPEIPAEIQQDEGLTYYYLFRACMIASKFTMMALCGQEKIEPVVPGWSTELLINSLREGDDQIEESGRGSIPLAVVSRRQCDVLITIRGTLTSFEWRMDFTYNQLFGNLTDTATGSLPKGRHHHGFVTLMASIYPAFLTYYGQVLDECSEATNRRIIVVGHSLGSGVATVLSHALAFLLKDVVEVSAVHFGPPQALDEEAADSYNRSVNSRAIGSNLDPITHIPCTPNDTPNGMMLCPNGNIKNGPGDEHVFYKKVNGQISITNTQLEALSGDERWSSRTLASLEFKGYRLRGIVLDAANLQMMAFHRCAYGCFTGQFCRNSDTEMWMCSDNSKRRLPDSVEPCTFLAREFPLSFTDLIGPK